MSIILDNIEYKPKCNYEIIWPKELIMNKYDNDTIKDLYNIHLKQFILSIAKIIIYESTKMKLFYASTNLNYFTINNEINKLKYNENFKNMLKWENLNLSYNVTKILNLKHLPKNNIDLFFEKNPTKSKIITINDDIIITKNCAQMNELNKFLENDINCLIFMYNNTHLNQTYLIYIYADKIGDIHYLNKQMNILKSNLEELMIDNEYVYLENATIPSDENSQNICIACYDDINIKFAMVPCGHTNLCYNCFHTLQQKNTCPSCRNHVHQFIKLF